MRTSLFAPPNSHTPIRTSLFTHPYSQVKRQLAAAKEEVECALLELDDRCEKCSLVVRRFAVLI